MKIKTLSIFLCLALLAACFTGAAASADGGTEDFAARYLTAAMNVLSEYAALDEEALSDFDESAHPELPWYTAIVANTFRGNALFFGLYDFDLNGVPELMIAAGNEDYQQPEAIYVFDGEKMVYLCKEMPLGERSSLCYFRDGLFGVRGSGGAASGAVALYRIAPDCSGSELVEIMDYQYLDENTVVYTPELGNMTAEAFLAGGYLQGFDVPIVYNRFAG